MAALPAVALQPAPLNNVVNLPPLANPPNQDDIVRSINYRKDIEHAKGRRPFCCDSIEPN